MDARMFAKARARWQAEAAEAEANGEQIPPEPTYLSYMLKETNLPNLFAEAAADRPGRENYTLSLILDEV